jgi:hypothetical protein
MNLDAALEGHVVAEEESKYVMLINVKKVTF